MTTALACPDPDDSRLPIPDRMRAEYERLRKLSDEELRREFGIALTLTAEHFLKLAAAARVMEERGHDLSELRVSMIGYLRKIAHGQLLPEVLADYGYKPLLLKNLSNLPLPDQARALREGVPVGIIQDDGSIDSVTIPLASLTSKQVRAAFAPDHLRTPQEQVRWLRFQRKDVAEPAPEKPPYVVNRGECIINRPTRLTKRDVQNILKAMER